MKLRMGQVVSVEILESLGDGHFIVSIDDHLIRTRCTFSSPPQEGKKLPVKVVAVEPLKLQVLTKKAQGLDIEA